VKHFKKLHSQFIGKSIVYQFLGIITIELFCGSSNAHPFIVVINYRVVESGVYFIISTIDHVRNASIKNTSKFSLQVFS